jgi:hypothetical protein
MKSLKFTIRGKIYELKKEEIHKKLKGVNPQPIREYYIEVENIQYPIKQVLATVTGLPPIGFTSKYAYDILTRLGFEVKR